MAPERQETKYMQHIIERAANETFVSQRVVGRLVSRKSKRTAFITAAYTIWACDQAALSRH
eukprot:5286670-Lingulodinium_polyedra.AAC.1